MEDEKDKKKKKRDTVELPMRHSPVLRLSLIWG
jgi:hypothetical protein